MGLEREGETTDRDKKGTESIGNDRGEDTVIEVTEGN